MGATSLLNVGVAEACACRAIGTAVPRRPVRATATRVRFIHSSAEERVWGTTKGYHVLTCFRQRRLQRALRNIVLSQRFLPPVRLRPPPERFRGTLPPSRCSSLRPMAIACLRLV